MAPHAESRPGEEDETMQLTPEQQTQLPAESSRPAPRQPRSQAQAALMTVKNRRREYLERNPAYFESAEHEFADPLLYDELVRKFQTPAEREAEGKAKGYGRVLEGSLLRGEARLAQLAGNTVEGGAASGSSTSALPAEPSFDTAPPSTTPLKEALALEADIATLSTPPRNREEATERWREFLRARFVRGGDEDFEYDKVDENEDYDTLARQDEEEAWFEDEEPDWASTGGGDGDGDEEERQTTPERILHGETGVQDY